MNLTIQHTPHNRLSLDSSVSRSDRLTETIAHTLMRGEECRLETLLETCSGFTWNQVFLAIDRMSRTGQLLLKRGASGDYSVSVLP